MIKMNSNLSGQISARQSRITGTSIIRLYDAHNQLASKTVFVGEGNSVFNKLYSVTVAFLKGKAKTVTKIEKSPSGEHVTTVYNRNESGKLKLIDYVVS